MGLYLLAPDAARFWTFFLGDGPTPSRAYLSSPRGHPGNRIANAFVIALVLVLPIADIVHKAVQRGVFHTDRLEGAWLVERRAGFDAGPIEEWRQGSLGACMLQDIPASRSVADPNAGRVRWGAASAPSCRSAS